jgi:hypothetical protein
VRQRTTSDQLGANSPKVVRTGIVAAFGRKAREVALAARAIMNQTMEAKEEATTKVEAKLSTAFAMRE